MRIVARLALLVPLLAAPALAQGARTEVARLLADARAQLERFRDAPFARDADLATSRAELRRLLENARAVSPELDKRSRADAVQRRNLMILEALFVEQVSTEGIDERFRLFTWEQAEPLLDQDALSPEDRAALASAANATSFALAAMRDYVEEHLGRVRFRDRSELAAWKSTEAQGFANRRQLLAAMAARPALRPYLDPLVAGHAAAIAALEAMRLRLLNGETTPDERLGWLAARPTVQELVPPAPTAGLVGGLPRRRGTMVGVDR